MNFAGLKLYTAIHSWPQCDLTSCLIWNLHRGLDRFDVLLPNLSVDQLAQSRCKACLVPKVCRDGKMAEANVLGRHLHHLAHFVGAWLLLTQKAQQSPPPIQLAVATDSHPPYPKQDVSEISQDLPSLLQTNLSHFHIFSYQLPSSQKKISSPSCCRKKDGSKVSGSKDSGRYSDSKNGSDCLAEPPRCSRW